MAVLPKVIILHGNGGVRIDQHWFPYLRREMELLGVEVVAQNLPDSWLGRERFWLPFVRDTLQADTNSIIVGHSSGAAAAMRYAETNSIYGSVLISAYHTDLGIPTERISGYFKRPWDFEAIRQNQNWVVQFAATDDPYIPIAQARHIRNQLKSEYYEFEDRGHFIGSNAKIFPELVSVLCQKILKAKA